MFDKKTRKKCWDIIKKYYPDYEDKNKLFLEFVEQYLKPEVKLLDVGCGRGKETPCVYKEKVKLSIGLDMSEAVSLNTTIHFPVVADANKIPLLDNSVDIVVSQELIEHLKCPEMFFGEVSRVLKPSGIFVIMTPNLIGWRSIVSKLTPYKFHVYMNKKLYGVSEHDVFPTYYYANSPRRIRKYLGEVGFKRLNQIMYEPTPRTLTFSTLTVYLEIFLASILRKYQLLSNLRNMIIVSYQKN